LEGKTKGLQIYEKEIYIKKFKGKKNYVGNIKIFYPLQVQIINLELDSDIKFKW